MKIAFYLNSFPVLSQTFIHRQMASLIEAGHEVSVVSERRVQGGDVHETVRRHGMTGEAVFLHERRSAGSLVSGTARWLATDASGFLSSAVRCAGEGGFRRLAKEACARHALAGKGYDAVVAHFGPAALEALRLAKCGALRGPLFPIFHGYDITRYVLQNGERVYRELFEHSAACLAISDRWARRLVELGCPPGKVAVHRVGLDVERIPFSPRESFSSPLRLLSVARLVEKKGIEHAIRAVADLSRSIDVEYSVVGDGPLSERLVALADGLGVRDRVTFLGALPEQEVERRMASADVLLVPSVVASDGDEEGIPVVIMEAMASGLPVIASRHSGIPELVEDGVTGTLVAEGDEAGLAAAIMRLCASGPDREKLDAARSKVEGLHSSTKLAHELEKLLIQAASH